EREQFGKWPGDIGRVGHCDSAEIVKQKIDARPREKAAKLECFGILGETQRRRLILKITGSRSLVPQRRTLGCFMDACSRLIEIDGSCRVVGERDVAQPVLNLELREFF